MPQSPADIFALIVTLTNKLANELPRNSEIATSTGNSNLSCPANEYEIGPR